MKHSLAQRYFEELREALNSLFKEPEASMCSPLATFPWFIIVFTVATCKVLTTAIIASILSIIIFVITHHKSVLKEVQYIIKPLILVLFIVFIVSCSLIVFKYNFNVYLFTSRVIASTITFIFILRVIGWRNVFTFLQLIKVPNEILFIVNQTIRFIPLFFNEALKILIAREARIIGNRWSLWRMSSSIISDIILKSYHRAWTFSLALNARILSVDVVPKVNGKVQLCFIDVYLFLTSLIIILMEVKEILWAGL